MLAGRFSPGSKTSAKFRSYSGDMRSTLHGMTVFAGASFMYPYDSDYCLSQSKVATTTGAIALGVILYISR